MNFIKDLSWLVRILLFTSTILSMFSIVSSIIAIIQIDLIENKTDSDNNIKIYLTVAIIFSALIFIMNLVILYRVYIYYGTDKYIKGSLFEKTVNEKIDYKQKYEESERQKGEFQQLVQYQQSQQLQQPQQYQQSQQSQQPQQPEQPQQSQQQLIPSYFSIMNHNNN